jgi:GNAT superfamily N-acetyltransferase
VADPPASIRVADERDVAALAGLRRAWLEERTGHPVDDPGFEAGFAQWWRVEQPRRTFWLAEVGSERSGWTAVGSINVLEIVHMPRPGARGGRIGHVGNAFVLASFADRGLPGALLAAVIEHARARRYRRLLLAPTPVSTAFYLRAGFVPAGDSLLALDPLASRQVPVERESSAGHPR